jgi:hypothetical protein
MRQLTCVFAALILAVVPLTAASAQSRAPSSVQSQRSMSNADTLLNVAPPTPTINPLNQVPPPLPAPSSAPTINGPLSQPLPAGEPGAGRPAFGLRFVARSFRFSTSVIIT